MLSILCIAIAIFKASDVRPVLTAYRGKDIPREYAKVEAADKAAHIERWKAKGGVESKSANVDLSYGGLFGMGLSNKRTFGPPPTYLEQKRAEAQKSYLEDQAHIAKNKDEWERLMEEDRQAQLKAMPSNLMGMMEAMTGGGPAQKAKEEALGKVDGTK